MKAKVLLSTLAAAVCFLPAAATGQRDGNETDNVDRLINRLTTVGCYAATVDFTVGMPQLSDDVVYTISLRQGEATGDSLMPCTYLIDWSLSGPQGESEGFSAYFNGNHYRFAGERLQEYHLDWDSVPFMPRRLGGMRGDGVQRTAQFVTLLPAVMADELRRMSEDPAYTITCRPDTLVGGQKVDAIITVMTAGGVTSSEGEYLFDKTTGMPLRVHLENSPGTISEQTVDATFRDTSDGSAACPPVTEETLIALYPEAFGSFRTSNFRIESLPGKRMPSFSLPTPTGERFTYQTGDPLPQPVMLALLETSGGFTAQFIDALRQAAAELPFESRLLMAFTDTNPDRIEETAGQLTPGETLLMSGRGLVRDCGAASLPSLIIIDRDGLVASVVVGFNNNLRSDVIQKMLLLQ